MSDRYLYMHVWMDGWINYTDTDTDTDTNTYTDTNIDKDTDIDKDIEIDTDNQKDTDIQHRQPYRHAQRSRERHSNADACGHRPGTDIDTCNTECNNPR